MDVSTKVPKNMLAICSGFQESEYALRVISGTAKGRKLKGPPSHATRPMTDKIKGAVFNALLSLEIEPERVLDLYAGTGSLGIEALSRGATHADFVDMGRDQVATIRANLTTTGFASVSNVHTMPVDQFLLRHSGSYDFVILDPPYADPEIIPMLTMVSRSHLVQSGGTVVIGHSPRFTLPDRLHRLERLRLRCHGDSCFSIYEVVSELTEEAE